MAGIFRQQSVTQALPVPLFSAQKKSRTALPQPPVTVSHPCPKKNWLVSDLDGSWLGQQRSKLQESVQQLGKQLTLVYATARPLARLLGLNLLAPAFTIAENGGLIYEKIPTDHTKRVLSWETAMGQARFDRPWIENTFKEEGNKFQFTVKDVSEGIGPEALYFSPYTAYLVVPKDQVEKAPKKFEAFIQAVRAKLDTAQMEYRLLTYPFAGQPYVSIDITASTLSKGDAIKHLTDQFGLDPSKLIVAGDGDNDIPMMVNDGRRAIVLGHGSQLRAHVESVFPSEKAMVRDPQEDSSLGILQGLLHHLAAIRKGS